MVENIIKVCMKLLYGETTLDGYYMSDPNTKDEKNYIFSSIFPSRSSMELALEQTSLED